MQAVAWPRKGEARNLVGTMTLPPQEPQDLQQSRRWPPSAVFLILANAVPLIGVLLHHWTVFAIVLLYWCENVIVGGFNVLRMVWARPQDGVVWVGKAFVVPFFMFHYGMFTFVHGVFVFALFGGGLAHAGSVTGFTAAAALGAIRDSGLTWPVAGLLASHAFSFFHNYLAGQEYRRAALPLLMFQPYTRVMVLHVAVLVGGFLAQTLGSPVFAMLLLIVLKTAIDLRAHLAERRKLGAGGGVPSGQRV